MFKPESLIIYKLCCCSHEYNQHISISLAITLAPMRIPHSFCVELKAGICAHLGEERESAFCTDLGKIGLKCVHDTTPDQYVWSQSHSWLLAYLLCS